MPAPLVPATLAYSADGTPYSTTFDDIYHSSAGGPEQARHVFLAGNELPYRWKDKERFTIIETGFGAGLNFLATWAAWKEDPGRARKLHFVSIEKYPFAVSDLASLHARHPGFEALSAELRKAWPMLVNGMHRLELDCGRVVLTLCFADVTEALRDLRCTADAFFLDGFSPAKNPAMWSVSVMGLLGRLAADGATVATYTVAASVKDALEQAGFSVAKRAGFARKRDMLCGRHVRRLSARRSSALPAEEGPPQSHARQAIVIGAGLAGAAVCERLGSRGWEVALIERHAASAREASGNLAGAFHPLVTRDDSFIARLSRASFLHALGQWPTLDGVSWARCGVLQMARDEAEDAAQRAALEQLGLPPEYAVYMDRAQAARTAGAGIASGGLWFGEGGWLQPASLVGGLLAKAKVSEHFGIEVSRLARSAGGWTALDMDGHSIATAPVVVLANAHDALRLAPLEHVLLRRVRGQVTYLPEEKLPQIRAVLLRGGMALPALEGRIVIGASYDIDETDPELRTDSHLGNLARLSRILPGADVDLGTAALDGRVGFRAVAPDRLPMLGALPGAAGLYGAFAYASRGILWSCLMAELLASQLEAEPLPIEARLADAVAPARFALRAQRRQQTAMDVPSRVRDV